MLLRDYFRVNNFLFEIKTDDKKAIDAIRSWLDEDIIKLHILKNNPVEQIINIRILSNFSLDDIPSTPEVSPEATFENISFYPGDGITIIKIDDTIIRIDYQSSSAYCYVSPEHIDSPWVISHRIFFLPALELLRESESFYLHAGCVFNGDSGILICGGSGQGKSTLTYALARSGFSYMSDDAVFLRANGRRTGMFSFPEKLKLDSSSCSFFSEFKDLKGIRGKKELSIGETKIEDVVIDGEPEFIIFPEISDNGSSDVYPIPDAEAMLLLIRQSVSLVGNERIGEHLDILKTLCEESQSYRLIVGNNFDDVARLIEGISSKSPA